MAVGAIFNYLYFLNLNPALGRLLLDSSTYLLGIFFFFLLIIKQMLLNCELGTQIDICYVDIAHFISQIEFLGLIIPADGRIEAFIGIGHAKKVLAFFFSLATWTSFGGGW